MFKNSLRGMAGVTAFPFPDDDKAARARTARA